MRDLSAELFLERHSHVVIERETGIERKLHIFRSGQVPHLNVDGAGLVINHQKRAIIEAIDAVEPQAKVEARDGRVGLQLGVCDCEWHAGLFESQPFSDQGDEAPAFEIEITRRHALSRASWCSLSHGALYMTGDERCKIGFGYEFRVRSDSIWRTGPDAVHDIVQEQTALHRGESGFSRIPAFRAEARGCECLEWALRL